jgi:hypothetical protein
MSGKFIKNLDTKYDEWVQHFIEKNRIQTVIKEIEFEQFINHELEFMTKDFTMNELKNRIEKLKSRSCSGDQMSEKKLKLLPNNVLEAVKNTFNNITNGQEIPNEWYN